MHNAFFTRFATASIAVVPLALVSILISIDGSHAGQTGGQRNPIDSPTASAQAETTARPRTAPLRRPADPALENFADALIFGRASAPDADPTSRASGPTTAAAPTRRDGQDEGTERGRAADWATGLASAPHGATPYGHGWLAAPQAVWSAAGQGGASRAFSAPTASPGSDNPASGPSIPGNPQVFYATENPVTVLTAASRGATPAALTEEPLAVLTSPVLTARNGSSQAIPEPASLGLALGALGLLGVARHGRQPARRQGR